MNTTEIVNNEPLRKYYNYTQKYVTKNGEVRTCTRIQSYVPSNGKRGPKRKIRIVPESESEPENN